MGKTSSSTKALAIVPGAFVVGHKMALGIRKRAEGPH